MTKPLSTAEKVIFYTDSVRVSLLGGDECNTFKRSWLVLSEWTQFFLSSVLLIIINASHNFLTNTENILKKSFDYKFLSNFKCSPSSSCIRITGAWEFLFAVCASSQRVFRNDFWRIMSWFALYWKLTIALSLFLRKMVYAFLFSSWFSLFCVLLIVQMSRCVTELYLVWSFYTPANRLSCKINCSVGQASRKKNYQCFLVLAIGFNMLNRQTSNDCSDLFKADHVIRGCGVF